MVAMKQIRDLSRSIAREFKPHLIVLFGSYATGKATVDSDVDMLVVLPCKGKTITKSVEIRMKLRPAFPLDLIVRTPQKVRQRISMGDMFMQNILTEGKVLYEANDV